MFIVGLATMVFGVRTVIGAGAVNPNVDNEMRFFGVWYATGGFFLLRAIRQVERHGTTIRVIGTAFFAAGCARLIGWAVVGRPHTLQLVLLAIELSLPVVLIPWQAAVARRTDRELRG